MRFHQITDPNAEDVQAALDIYVQSFPQNQRYCTDLIRERLAQGREKLIVGRARHEVIFFALLWPLQDSKFVLLDSMATRASNRGCGIGSEFLGSLSHIEEFRSKHFIIEIEDPASGSNRLERRQRLEFYKRRGAMELGGVQYFLPPLSGGAATEMRLLILPRYDDGKIAAVKVRGIITQIYQELYNRGPDDDLLNTFIHEITGSIKLV